MKPTLQVSAFCRAPQWTSYMPAAWQLGSGRVRRVGLNFGAPGDRRGHNGTLWLDYPSVGGPSPHVPVNIKASGLEWFRHHSSRVEAGDMKWVAASGGRGIRQLTVTLDKEAKQERSYTVRLHFAEPEQVLPGERLFYVTIRGRKVLKEFDIVKEAGGPNRAVVKEFKGIKAKGALSFGFGAASYVYRDIVVCGIEIIEQGR